MLLALNAAEFLDIALGYPLVARVCASYAVRFVAAMNSSPSEFTDCLGLREVLAFSERDASEVSHGGSSEALHLRSERSLSYLAL